jgi:hypothetical protein
MCWRVCWTLDAKHEIYNRRDAKQNASGAAVGAKKTVEKTVKNTRRVEHS